jgi:hypothetical protein
MILSERTPLARQSASPKPSASDVLIGREPDILPDIHAPGVAAAVWRRTPDPAFQSWIDDLDEALLPRLRTSVPVHMAETAVLTACGIAKTPPGPELDRFAGDVGALALMYCRIMETDHVRIRLDVTDETMCPKFHLDNVPARLLCTYRGEGTEYVAMRYEHDPRRIRHVQTGDAALLRGRNWPSEERCGLLHRSPPMTPGSRPRLLLVLDVTD